MTAKKIYHRDIYIPSQILNMGETRLILAQISKHARHEMTTDKYAESPIEINEGDLIVFNPHEIVEVEIQKDGFKFLIRLPYDGKNDIMLAIKIYHSGYNVLKTVWLNDWMDEHYTLDESKYYHPTPEEIFS